MAPAPTRRVRCIRKAGESAAVGRYLGGTCDSGKRLESRQSESEAGSSAKKIPAVKGEEIATHFRFSICRVSGSRNQ
jgi:hypothetical protein